MLLRTTIPKINEIRYELNKLRMSTRAQYWPDFDQNGRDGGRNFFFHFFLIWPKIHIYAKNEVSRSKNEEKPIWGVYPPLNCISLEFINKMANYWDMIAYARAYFHFSWKLLAFFGIFNYLVTRIEIFSSRNFRRTHPTFSGWVHLNNERTLNGYNSFP